MGKGSQDDFNDAKIWLEPEIEVARPGRTLKRHALGQALKVIFDTFALGKWTIIVIGNWFVLWDGEELETLGHQF